MEISKELTDHTGRPFVQKRKYTVLQNGLHYTAPETGEWRESEAVIEAHPIGAIATKGPHQVIFNNNINTRGAIDYLSPDGKRLRSHVLALYFTSIRSGESVLIAQVQDSVGKILEPNRIVYEDCFDGEGVRADLLYTYMSGSFEQDVVIQELPDPQAFGFEPELVRLEVLTEFVEAPQPGVKQHVLREAPLNVRSELAIPDFIDEELVFGSVKMTVGRAFKFPKAEQGGGKANDPAFPVAKKWERIADRSFLLEAVEFVDIAPMVAKVHQEIEGEMLARAERVIPNQRELTSMGEPVAFASSTYSPTGAVIDYYLVYGQANYTFASNETYLVDGSVSIDNAYIDSGAIIKYSRETTIWIAETLSSNPNGKPAILTARDDNTVGEDVSTGLLGGYYANPAILVSHTVTNPVVLENIQIRHAGAGVEYSYFGTQPPTHIVRNSDLINCWVGVGAYDGSVVSLESLIFCDVETDYIESYSTVYTNNLTYLSGQADADADKLSNRVELSKFLCDPMNGSSQSQSTDDGVFFTTAGFGTDTQAQLIDIVVSGGEVTLTLDNARPDDFYDIFFAEQITGPWSLRHSGAATAGEGTTTKSYTFPEPSSSTGFFRAWLGVDTDFDGLRDGYEVMVTGTINGNPDSDGNQRPDGSEDFDGDWLRNSLEQDLRTDPFTANSKTDTDGDGLPDWLARVIMDDPLDAVGASPTGDADNDGQSNLKEWYIKTNPMLDEQISYHVEGIGRDFTLQFSEVKTLGSNVTLTADHKGVMSFADIRNMAAYFTFQENTPSSGDVTIEFKAAGMGNKNFAAEYDEVIESPDPDDKDELDGLFTSITISTAGVINSIAGIEDDNLKAIKKARTARSLRQEAAASMAAEYRKLLHWAELGADETTIRYHALAAQDEIHTQMTRFAAVSKRLEQLDSNVNPRYLKYVSGPTDVKGGLLTVISVISDWNQINDLAEAYVHQMRETEIFDQDDTLFGDKLDTLVGGVAVLNHIFVGTCQLWRDRI